MTETEGAPAGALGYVAQVSDAHSFVGGLFVVGPEGDPLDFAYTEPVVLSPLERFLLGARMEAYLLARVMLPALLKQASVTPAVVLIDEPTVLLRRPDGAIPLVVLAPGDAAFKPGAWTPLSVSPGGAGAAFWAGDGGATDALFHLSIAAGEMAPFSITEPFEQVRRTLAEMRRGRG